MKHPLSICGAVVFGGSWIFLIAGVSGSPYSDVVNLHSLFLGQSGIMSGIGLFLAGILLDKPVGVGHSDDLRMLELKTTDRSEPALEAEERERLARELRAAIDEAKKSL